MSALLTAPHWLIVTGHVLFVAWPWVATVAAGLLFSFSKHLAGELTKTEVKLHNAEVRLGSEQAILANYRNNRETHLAYQYAREWEQRYRLQVQICEGAHIERPLPTMPLDP